MADVEEVVLVSSVCVNARHRRICDCTCCSHVRIDSESSRDHAKVVCMMLSHSRARPCNIAGLYPSFTTFRNSAPSTFGKWGPVHAPPERDGAIVIVERSTCGPETTYDFYATVKPAWASSLHPLDPAVSNTHLLSHPSLLQLKLCRLRVLFQRHRG